MQDVETTESSSLRARAREARDAAHAPYSGFRVGACLESEDGRAFAGCNVENASLPVTICAERVALGSAIVAGANRFRRIFLVSDAEAPVAPCGMCRQALAEFAPQLVVTSEGRNGTMNTWSLRELLPARFSLDPHTEGGSEIR